MSLNPPVFSVNHILGGRRARGVALAWDIVFFMCSLSLGCKVGVRDRVGLCRRPLLICKRTTPRSTAVFMSSH